MGETIGFAVIAPHRDYGALRASHILVSGTIYTVTAEGSVREVVKRRSENLQSHQKFRIAYATPSSPSTYRVEISFKRRKGGRRIARYGQYFHAAPPLFDARVALSGTEVTAGASLFARLENTGVERVGTGYGYSVERFLEGSWEVDQGLQGEQDVPRVGVSLGAGASFDCVQLRIPADQPPGRYRLTKRVSKNFSRKRRIVAGVFSIRS